MPAFLWEDRGVVPFLKVDKGLEAEADGVSLMKPIGGLDELLARAVKLGIYGTKMRSTINLRDAKRGIAAIAEAAIRNRRANRKARAHADSRTGSVDQEPRQGRGRADSARRTTKGLDALPAGRQVMLKLTIPDVPDLYAPLIATDKVATRGRAFGRLHARRRLRAARPDSTA